MWHDFFDAIVLLNLDRRADRLEQSTQTLNEYGIPFQRFAATENESGAIGLAMTMKSLFVSALDNKVNKILVFEDDVSFVVSPDQFTETMNKCTNDLSTFDWGCFYLGLQHCRQFQAWKTPNLLHVNMGYSTHAVAYSKHAMEFFIRMQVNEPIDNFLVREYQPYNTSYCSYPLLATQLNSYSDIAKDKPNWDRYISPNFERFTKDILSLRYKK
jgi:GR25 family glycosyltransferase involved in LPS biosynthesis